MGCLWEAASAQDRNAELQEEDCSTELRAQERLASSPVYRRNSKPASLTEAVVRPAAGPAHPASHRRGDAAEAGAASGEPRLSVAAPG